MPCSISLVYFDVFLPSHLLVGLDFLCITPDPLLHLPLEEIKWPGVCLCVPQLALAHVPDPKCCALEANLHTLVGSSVTVT